MRKSTIILGKDQKATQAFRRQLRKEVWHIIDLICACGDLSPTTTNYEFNRGIIKRATNLNSILYCKLKDKCSSQDEDGKENKKTTHLP